jgi:hypothetical protein
MTSLAGLYDWLVADKAASRAEGQSEATDYRLRALPREDILLFVKEIDNDNLVQVRDRSDWAASVSMTVGVLVASLVLIGLLLPGGYSLLASRRVNHLQQQRESMINQLRELRVQEAALLSPRQVEKWAGDRYVTPPASAVVHAVPVSRSTVASLEAR